MSRTPKEYDVDIGDVHIVMLEPTLGQMLEIEQNPSMVFDIIKECSIPKEDLYLSELVQALDHLVAAQRRRS